jgi:hypothetical protein
MDGRGCFSDTRAASTQENYESRRSLPGGGPTGVRGRLQTARGLTPFVRREDEMWLLLNR